MEETQVCAVLSKGAALFLLPAAVSVRLAAALFDSEMQRRLFS